MGAMSERIMRFFCALFARLRRECLQCQVVWFQHNSDHATDSHLLLGRVVENKRPYDERLRGRGIVLAIRVNE